MIDAAIEQAARRLGVWAAGGADSCAGVWYIYGRRGSGTYSIQMFGAAPGWRDVPAPTAALFLLLLGLPDVAVTCPDCLARGAGGKLARWEWSRLGVWSSGGYNWRQGQGVKSRPCLTCTVDGQPLGQVQREPARLLLDAIWLSEFDDSVPTEELVPRREGGWLAPGDPTARDALAVLADQLQAHGDQRGTWVALWLAGPEVFARVLVEVEADLVASGRRECICDTGTDYDCPIHGADASAGRLGRKLTPAVEALRAEIARLPRR